MTYMAPDYLEVYGHFRQYVGPRYIGAGLRIHFCHDQVPGIHFGVQPLAEEYRDSIIRGLADGMALRFPEFLSTGTIWITEITEHPVDSSQNAFYCAARMAIDQAFSVHETRKTQTRSTAPMASRSCEGNS